MLDGLRRSVQDKKIIGTISEMAVHCARPVTLETWTRGALTCRPVTNTNMFRTVSDTSYRGMWWFAEWKDLTPTTRLPPLQFSVVHSQFSLRDEYHSCFEFIRLNDGRGPVLYGYATMAWGTPFLGWVPAQRWQTTALAVCCPLDYERVYVGETAADTARLALRPGDELYEEVAYFCPDVPTFHV